MKNKRASAKVNYIYSVAYSALTTLLPLVTAPYISRVVGAYGLGIYNYNYTIVMYFMLFAMLGVGYYGNRAIAKVRDDSEERSRVFSEIYSLQLLTAGIVAIIYLIYLLFFVKDNQIIAGIMFLYVLAPSITVNWFFYGLEMFKVTVIRNFIVKIVTVMLIFVFVKCEDDLWKYTLILALGSSISEGYLIIYVHKYVHYSFPRFKNVIKHFKPNLVLFIPIIAVSIYRTMDKLMLKWMVDYVEVAFYSNAEKIVNICVVSITALGQVMLPKMTNLMAKGDVKQFNELIGKSVKFSSFLSCAMVFGIYGVSRTFIPIFYGEGYDACIPLLQLLSINLMFLAWGNVLKSEFLIPKERDSLYIHSVFWGAVLNLIINLLLIPKVKAIGAAIGTITAEIFSLCFILIGIRSEFNIKQMFKDIIPFSINGVLMLLVVQIIDGTSIGPFYKLVIEIIIGASVYIILSLLYWHITKDEMGIIASEIIRKITRGGFQTRN